MHLDGTQFGSITVSGSQFHHDLVFVVAGSTIEVNQRDKSRSQRIHGHRELAQVELEELLACQPEVLILGMGQYGSLPMAESTKDYLMQQVKKQQILLIQGDTPEILERANQQLKLHKRCCGLLHVTC